MIPLESRPEGAKESTHEGCLHFSAIRIEAQGSLLKVTELGTEYKRNKPRKPPKRGKVAGQSGKSRKRLLELVARLSNARMLTFITVTYRTAPTIEESKIHLHAFLQRIRRHAPKAAVIWKMEFQQRGAVHFHLLCFNLPFWRKEQVQQAWASITGEERPFTRIENIRERKKALSYVAKYMAKAAGRSGFNYVPYPNANTGRTWGIRQRENLVFAEQVVIELLPRPKTPEERKKGFSAYLELRQKAARLYKPIAYYECVGFSVFTEHAYGLIRDLTVTI